MQAGLPIVPVSIVGTRHVMRKGELTTRPGRVRLIVHQPIPTTADPEPKPAAVRALAREVREIVRQAPDAEAGIPKP
jgi:1-acyl-sn-glycerol-3-phosphate acyltransferase